MRLHRITTSTTTEPSLRFGLRSVAREQPVTWHTDPALASGLSVLHTDAGTVLAIAGQPSDTQVRAVSDTYQPTYLVRLDQPEGCAWLRTLTAPLPHPHTAY